MRHDAALLIHNIKIEVAMGIGEPYFLVIFFGIFHIVGGLAFGKGLRERISDKAAGNSLIVWGILMGGLPIIFSWVFLLREGYLVAGWIGPALFVVSSIFGGIFFIGELSRKNEKSIGAILMGGTSLMLGLMIASFLIKQAQTQEGLGVIDYLCGGSIPIFFIFIGGSFAWTGLTAIRKKRDFDGYTAEQEMEIEEKSKKRKGKTT
jgi:hypothetical protein